MSIAIWNDGYLTGDPTVDAQHRELFAMVNGLHAAIVEGHGKDQLLPTLERLGKYVGVHFATEESLMQRHGFPGFAAHKAKHDALARSAGEVIAGYRSGKAVLGLTLSRFLSDWIAHHIDGEDKGMIRWLREHPRPA